MKQHVHSPTRDDHLLDILACSDDQLIHDVVVDYVFHVLKRWTSVTYKFHPLSKMDFDFFEQSLLSSSLFTDPDNTVDAFVDQLHNVVTSTPDKLAPLRTVDRISGGSHINQFLSQEATHAKRYRRKLERSWKKTGAEADRLTYRQQCKLANNLTIGL